MADQNFDNLVQNLRNDNKEDYANIVQESLSLLKQNISPSDKTNLSNDLNALCITYQAKPGFFGRIFSGGKFNERIRTQVENLNITKGQVEKNLQNQNQQSSNVIKIDEKKQDENKGEILVIARNEFTTDNMIKRSTLFETYQGKWKEKDVFIKKITIPDENQMVEQRNHYLIQYYLKNKNIVELYGYFQQEAHELWLLFEPTPYGSLFDLIHTHKISISLALSTQMLRDIANAMNYLHTTTPYLHRDLSSECVMIFNESERCTIKVTDFYHLRALTAHVTYSASKVGKELWMAPEILVPETDNSDSEDDEKNNDTQNDTQVYQYSKQSDVWSFSITAYEVICLRLPFLGDVGELITKLRNQKRPVIDRRIREDPEYHDLIELMKRCWAQEFDARPLFSVVLEELDQQLKKYSEEQLNEASTQLLAALDEKLQGQN